MDHENHTDDETDEDSESLHDIVDVDRIVQEAMSLAADEHDITLLPASESEFEDAETDPRIQGFLSSGCGCRLNDGRPCSNLFDTEKLETCRLEANELSRGELDLVIMGKLAALSRSDRDLRKHTGFLHGGKRVCKKTFLFLHDIGEKRLKNVMKHYQQNGLTVRIHGNTKRSPHNALSFFTVKNVVTFVLHYSEQHSLVMPGRIPGYSRCDMQLLPSSTSKKSIWNIYKGSSELNSPAPSVGYSTFCRLWRTLVPNVITMKPMSDLCWTCQQNSATVLRMSNAPENEKSQVLKEALEHLRVVEVERAFYRDILNRCKSALREQFATNGVLQLPPAPCAPQSLKIPIHYSFDYAQQIHYPSDPLQPGPMYFLTCRKCSVFGVCCESIPLQVNFLTDEAADGGKGANAVVSRIHYYFEHYGLGEEEAFLHADNCAGQKKITL